MIAGSKPPWRSLRWSTSTRSPTRFFVILDEGCNKSVHGSKWFDRAARVLERAGFMVPLLTGTPKNYRGLGQLQTCGKRTVPWAIRLRDGTIASGHLSSNEIPNSNQPLLLSIVAQGTLGLVKDVAR